MEEEYPHSIRLIRDEVKMYLLRYEQRVFVPSHAEELTARCVWCGQLGGDYFPPITLRDSNPNWGVFDMHEWLFKRSSGLPPDVIFTRVNCALFHPVCHSKFGQTREMTEKCLKFKAGKGYDINEYINRVKALHPSVVIENLLA